MPLHVLPVDYQLSAHRDAVVMLLDAYARDPMGGGEGLTKDVKSRLCDDLATRPTAASFIAWLGDEPVGLVNCIEGYSTFKAQPLMNIHDIAVLPDHRGAGVGQALLAAAERHARTGLLQAHARSAHGQCARPVKLYALWFRPLRTRPGRRPGQLHAEVALNARFCSLSQRLSSASF